MTLVLTITSFHKFTPEIESEFIFDAKGEHEKVSFGRSEQCDWILPDPERVISGKHGELIKFGDKYLIKDLSTNGTFVNNSVSPIGQGNEVTLSQDDVVTLGDYQIQVTIQQRQLAESPEQPVESTLVSEPHTSDDFINQDDFGLSASELLKDSASSEFQLDIGLMDDFVEPSIQTQQEQELPHFAVEEPIKAHQKTSSNKDVEAFIRGLGISPNMVPDEQRELWFQQLGESFSLMLTGLMETLHHRAEFKQSNRLNHTAFRKSENNPLKFSANLEDAIHNLYNRKTASFMRPDLAIKEAFNDVENHEKALMQGVNGTVISVMSLVEPSSIYSESLSNDSFLNKVMPARKYSQSWKRFEAIYNQLADDVVNKESPFYLDDFAKHYENALRRDS
ncbi:FHA domain-containing protein [Vibrio hyugaensis]|uniref:FHA domain-containing protein n=1 Tax=Vibrio hyugaensis TaxID=1534743 RepID=A0ABQ5Y227_9VIBR|nr:type VI secretion system-associated FHA domain protein TagH [Vibrio hyugaensis]GLR04968.1 FHA domain-containing protein [Vibrio hyugaensis]